MLKKISILGISTLLVSSSLLTVTTNEKAYASEMIISKEDYYDKTLAGVLGQVGGVLSGYEFVSEDPIPQDKWQGLIKGEYSGRGDYYREDGNIRIENNINGRILSDDDYHIDFFNQHILDNHGPDTSFQDIKDEWTEHQVNDWGGGYAAMENMNKYNMLPPLTGKSESSIFYWLTESYIENDTLGMNTPGMPQTASKLTEKFASVTGEFDSVTWAKFVSTMYSIAYFEDDARIAMEKASFVLPKNSWPYEIYNKVKELYQQNPNDWRWAQSEIRKLKRNVYGQDNVMAIPDINNALVILSILYGENNYEKSGEIASLSGYDADCTASAVLGLMGIIKGMSGTPQVVKDAIYANGNGVYINDFNFTPHINNNYPKEQKFTDIASLYQKNAEKFIIKNNGWSDANNFYINIESNNTSNSAIPIENYDFEKGDLSGWTTWQPRQDQSKIFAEANGTALSGNWKGTIVTDDNINEGKLYVKLDGLEKGSTYQVKAYLHSADGQEARLYAENYGGPYIYSAISSRPGFYAARNIEFTTTTGSAELGLHVPPGAKGLKWAAIDNIKIEKVNPDVIKKYEAEEASVSEGNVKISDSASAGKYIGGLDNIGSKVDFKNVYVDNAGEYILKINYANGWTKDAFHNLYINDVKKAAVKYPRSQRWGEFSKNIIEVPVVLKQGENSIKLVKEEDAGFAEIDYIEIEKYIGDRNIN